MSIHGITRHAAFVEHTLEFLAYVVGDVLRLDAMRVAIADEASDESQRSRSWQIVNQFLPCGRPRIPSIPQHWHTAHLQCVQQAATHLRKMFLGDPELDVIEC